MDSQATAGRDPIADTQLTPEDQARKEHLQATARAAEAGVAAKEAAEARKAAEAHEGQGGASISIPDLERLIAELRDRAEAENELGQVVELTALKRTLDKALRQVKGDLAPLHEQIEATFAAEGVTSKRHAPSGKLVYLSRRIWARAADGDKEAACDALEGADLGDYVGRTYNTQSLSAYFNERAEEIEALGKPVTDVEELLPEELRGVITLTRDTTIGVRS